MTFSLGKPAELPRWKPADHLQHLNLFAEPRREEVPAFDATKGTQIIAVCSYVACITCGRVWADVNVYGEVLAGSVYQNGDELVPGILVQARPKPGKNGAYYLENPTPADNERVLEFLKANAERLDSGRIVITEPDDEPF